MHPYMSTSSASEPRSGGQDSTPLRVYVESLFDEMHQRTAHLRAVVMRYMDGAAATASGAEDARRLQELLAALREAVVVLEETKRSFKSKRLGELRENLERVLDAQTRAAQAER